MSKKETYNVKKLSEEEIVDYVKGLFDGSVGLMQTEAIENSFNYRAWGCWMNMLEKYDIDTTTVNVFFSYRRLGRIRVVRKEDMQEVLNRYHATNKILLEIGESEHPKLEDI